MLSCHCHLYDGLLHGPPILVHRLRTEAVKAEPAGELLAGVMSFSAPFTGGIGAGSVA